MSALVYRADLGGTARLIQKIYRADAGGVVHAIKKRYRADASGIVHRVFNAVYVGSLIAATASSGGTSHSGYFPPWGLGSLNPTVDRSGFTINNVVYTSIPGSGIAQFELDMSGFSSDPTQFYFTELVLSLGGTISTFTSASASLYSYTPGSPGQAAWQWNVPNPFTGGSGPYTFEIIYP